MQQQLLQAILDLGKPVALVLFNGSPLTINWAHENVPAILEAWYPGEEGGTAIADILFGDYNPAGRLPEFTDDNMTGRTYRHLQEPPPYPFGYGISYTQFGYSNFQVKHKDPAVCETVSLQVDVENIGFRSGDEVVQLYLKHLEASCRVPQYELQGVQRVHLKPGERQTLGFTVDARQMAVVNEQGQFWVEPGEIQAFVGGSQPDQRSQELTGQKPLTVRFTLAGQPVQLDQ